MGQLKTVKVRGSVRITESELERFVTKQLVKGKVNPTGDIQ
jgi:hypothetical protein